MPLEVTGSGTGCSQCTRVLLAWGCFLALILPFQFQLLAADPAFAREVLPVLSDHCFACHGPDDAARKGGLRLDVRSAALGPGRSKAIAVVPGQRAASEVFRRLTSHDTDDVMPPAKARRRPTPEQIEAIGRWIDRGAEWSRHWAYEPPFRPTVPPDADGNAPRAGSAHPVDAFVRSRLRREGLTPAPEAARTTLLRRASLDLTGLPPTPGEIDAYLADSALDAYERVVDRLLASPRFGERMAWEWLEAARYADSNGYQGDSERSMWPWRDWVVSAFNRNLPFDQFTLFQLAGDLLPGATVEQRLATGFVRNHAINGEGGRIPEENRVDYLFDQTETLGTVWLAATLNCTRCHNHKFDPITQRDYFGLLAVFNRTAVDGSGGDPQTRPNLEVPSPEQSADRARLAEQLRLSALTTTEFERLRFPRSPGKPASDSPSTNGLPPEILGHLGLEAGRRDAGRLEKLAAFFKERDLDYARQLSDQRRWQADLDALVRSIPRVMVMEDSVTNRDTFMFTRGLYNQPTTKVTASLPPSLGPVPATNAPAIDRLALARWLVAPDHPLTARVAVNRFWQSVFGIGLVKTAEDFGVQGERPSHPELLDWLATEFVDTGWDVKKLLRLLVTSATYRQSSRATPVLVERDPENRWLARGPRHRLPSWMIRDSALASAGLLAEQVGGPPVRPYQPTGVWEEATFGNKRYLQDHGAALYRRSLYVFWRRIIGPTMFFDVANRQTCTVRTPRTNVPLHALLTLNDVTYLEAARALAARVLAAGAFEPDTRLDLAGRFVLGRPLESDERAILHAGLARHGLAFKDQPDAARRLLAQGESAAARNLDPVELAAWTMVCHTLLNLDEALSKE